MKPLYERYVTLKHADQGAAWRAGYESIDFEADVAGLYAQLEPLYRELHAFVRRRLSEVYGEDRIDVRGPLPAHVLGDMWGRFWASLYEHMVPYPNKPSIDPSEEMKRQNYTVEKIYQVKEAPKCA